MPKKKSNLGRLTIQGTRRKRTRLMAKRKSQIVMQAHLVSRKASPLVSSSSSNTSCPSEGEEMHEPKRCKIDARVPEVEMKSANEEKEKGIRTRLSTGTLAMAGTSTFSLSAAKTSGSSDPAASSSSTKIKPTSSQGTSPISEKDQPPKNGKDSLKRKFPVDQSEDKDSPTVPPKKKKIGRNDGSGEDNKNDYFCWLCHKEGRLICCELCPRVFHDKCLNSTQNIDQDWVCPECEKTMQAECTDTRSEAMSRISIDMLCTLLRYALDRMKAVGASTFEKPVNPSVFLNYSDYVFHPMCLSQLEKNIRRKQYGSTEAFLSDAKWIMHNSIVYNGSPSDITSAAKSLLKVCKHELNEIEVCPDCYMNSCVQSHQEWFCEPCSKPHAIVWAKLKGYPFWPAKVLREVNGHVDVRFFGAHDRSWVPVSACFMFSKESPSLVKKSRSGMDMAIKEVKVHIQKLRERFGNFTYAAHRTSYSKTQILKQLNPTAPKPSSQKAMSKEQTSKASQGVPNSKFQAIAPKQSTSTAPVSKTLFRTSSPPLKASAKSGKELATTGGSLPTSLLGKVVMTRMSPSTTAPSVITTPSGSALQLKQPVIYIKPMQKGVFMLSQSSAQQLSNFKSVRLAVPRPSMPDPQLLQRIVTKINPQGSNTLMKSSSTSQDVTASTSATENVSSLTVSSSASSTTRNDSTSLSESRKSSAPTGSTTAIVHLTSGSKLMPSSIALAKSPPPLIQGIVPVTSKNDSIKSALPSADLSSISLSMNQKDENPENAGKTELERAPDACDIDRVGGSKTLSSRVSLNQNGTETTHHSQMEESSLTSSLDKFSRTTEEQSNSSKPILRGILSEANSTSTFDSGHVVARSQGNDAKDPASQNSKSTAEKESLSKGEEERLSDSEKQSSHQLTTPDTVETSCRRESSEMDSGKNPEIAPQKSSALSVALPSATTSESAVHQSRLSPGSIYKSSLQKVIDSCKEKLGMRDEDMKSLEKEEGDDEDDLLAESDSDELHLCLDYDDDEETGGIADEENVSDKKQASEKSNGSPSSNRNNETDLSDTPQTAKISKTASKWQTEGVESEDHIISKNSETADLSKPVEGLEHSHSSDTHKRFEKSVSESCLAKDTSISIEKSNSTMPQKIQMSQHVDQDSESVETSNFKTSQKEGEIPLEGSDPENRDNASNSSVCQRTSDFQTCDDGEKLDSVSQPKDHQVCEISTEEAKSKSDCQEEMSDSVAKAPDNQSDAVSGIQGSEKPSALVSGLEEMSNSVLGAKESQLSNLRSTDGSQMDCNTEPGSTSEDEVTKQRVTVTESEVSDSSLTSTQTSTYMACQTKEIDQKQTSESVSITPPIEEKGSSTEDEVTKQHVTVTESVVSGSSVPSTQTSTYMACQTKEMDKKQTSESVSVTPPIGEKGSSSEDEVTKQRVTVTESVVSGSSVPSTQTFTYMACQTKEMDKKQTESVSVTPPIGEKGSSSEDEVTKQHVTVTESVVSGSSVPSTQAFTYMACQTKEMDKKQTESVSVTPSIGEKGSSTDFDKDQKNDHYDPDIDLDMEVVCEEDNIMPDDNTDEDEADDVKIEKVSEKDKNQEQGHSLSLQTTKVSSGTAAVRASSFFSNTPNEDAGALLAQCTPTSLCQVTTQSATSLTFATTEAISLIATKASTATTLHLSSQSCLSPTAMSTSAKSKPSVTSAEENDNELLDVAIPSSISIPGRALLPKSSDSSSQLVPSSSTEQLTHVVHGSSTSSSPSLKDQDIFISLVDDTESVNDNLVRSVNGDDDDDDESCIMMQTHEPCIDLDAMDEETTVETAGTSDGVATERPGSECSSGRPFLQLSDSSKDSSLQLETSLESLFHSSTSKITAWLSAQLNELKASTEEMFSNQKKSSAATIGDREPTDSDLLLEKMKKEVTTMEHKLADWQIFYERTVGELKETYLQERQAGLANLKKLAEQHLLKQLAKTKQQMAEKHAAELKSAVSETKQKQWCAECWKEAVYYCCWNTSYCSYQCQQKHWPNHLPTCMQAQQQQQKQPPDATSVAGSQSQSNRISLGRNVTIIKPTLASVNSASSHIVKTISGPKMSTSKVNVVPAALWHMAGRDEAEGKRSATSTSVPPSVPSTVPRTTFNPMQSAANVVGNSLQVLSKGSTFQASACNTNLSFSPAQGLQPVQFQYLTQPPASQQQLQIVGGANPNIPVLVPPLMAGGQNISANVQLLQNSSVFPMVQQQQQTSQPPVPQAQQPIRGSFILNNSFGGMLHPAQSL